MINRIKELAKEHFCSTEFDNGHIHECYEFSESELEKFVTMIVQECATICVNVSDTTRVNDTPHEGDVCSYKIKQHFGVKE